MHWGVIEVIPEADFYLFVSFKDGLSGRVQLDPREFPGVLAPLLDAEFFNRVYIDDARLHGPETSLGVSMPSSGKSLVNGSYTSAVTELIIRRESDADFSLLRPVHPMLVVMVNCRKFDLHGFTGWKSCNIVVIRQTCTVWSASAIKES